MQIRFFGAVFFAFFLAACQSTPSKQTVTPEPVQLTLAQAEHLAQLPLGCVTVEYPNKLNQTLDDASQLRSPKALHPAFYGCFDWHSSVHGHWSLAMLLKEYPQMAQSQQVIDALKHSLTADKILAEVAYFDAPSSGNYERPYGWAWLLKLAAELHDRDDQLGNELEQNLKPLTDLIAQKFVTFLPKLNYPMREGTHKNTAFALALAWDYGETVGDEVLLQSISDTATRFYADDKNCPLSWEPSGSDFISPCLEEANIMRKVMSAENYRTWLKAFLPSLSNSDFALAPGEVSDRADGHLVHLDGLNFSRAWCLYGIAQSLPEYDHLRVIADQHIRHSLPAIVDDNYSGTHWLGSFALQALRYAK